MGFGKKSDEATKSGRVSGKKENGANSPKEFVPSTKEDLKAYAKAARKREKQKQRGKEESRNERVKPEPLKPLDGLKPRALLKRYFKIMGEKIAAYEADKKADKRWTPTIPKYADFGNDEVSDANFLNQVQTSIAGMSWTQLKRLVKGGFGADVELPPTFTKCFHMAEQAMYQALGTEIDDTDVRYILTDRDATLKLWPVEREVKKVSKKNRDEEAAEPKKKKKKKKVVEEAAAEETKDAPQEKKSKVKDKKKPKEGGEKKARTRVSDDAVFKVVKQFKGGVREQAQSFISKKGSTMDDIVKSARKGGMQDGKKVRNYIKWLASNGYVKAA